MVRLGAGVGLEDEAVGVLGGEAGEGAAALVGGAAEEEGGDASRGDAGIRCHGACGGLALRFQSIRLRCRANRLLSTVEKYDCG